MHHDQQQQRLWLLPGIPLALALIAIAALALWLFGAPTRHLPQRLPGQDNAPTQAAASAGPIDLAASIEVQSLADLDNELPGAWPGFRGPDRDNVAKLSPEPLSADWAANPPEVLWRVPVGEGYAAPAVLNSRVYLLDYDRENERDLLRCLALEDGRELWQLSYPVRIKRNHGMSRTVPAVTPDHVVTLGPMCHVVCADATTGKLNWTLDLVNEYGTEVPLWYAGQCPLIDNGRVILAPGGSALMMAVDLASGEVVWETPNPDSWQMTHSSITPATFGATKAYVYCGSGGVVAVNAENGEILWQTTSWKVRVNVPSPVILDDNRIFLTAGYNAGAVMMQVTENAGTYEINELYRLPADTFASEQQSPIYYQGHLYAVRPDDQLACLDPDTGQVVWNSGSENTFGLGPLLIVSGEPGLLYVMDDTGLVTLATATPQGYLPRGQLRVFEGHDAWGPMALAGSRLLVREFTELACLDVSD